MTTSELIIFLKHNGIKLFFDGTAFGYNVIIKVPLDKVKIFIDFIHDFNSTKTPLQSILETDCIGFEITPLCEHYNINPNDL